jgi:hypothetical protein
MKNKITHLKLSPVLVTPRQISGPLVGFSDSFAVGVDAQKSPCFRAVGNVWQRLDTTGGNKKVSGSVLEIRCSVLLSYRRSESSPQGPGRMHLQPGGGSHNNAVAMTLQVEDFQHEMAAAVKHYEKYVVCVEKTPDEFLASLQSLMAKAIDAFEHRAEGLRHGIALDRHLTIILSESDGHRPLCGIYFNLHSPYRKRVDRKES